MLIQASRTRSAVGRTRESFGTTSRRPPNRPATMRTSRPRRVRTERAEARLERAESLPVVGLEPEGRIHEALAQPGGAVGPLEPDGGELGRAVLQQPLEMPAPHDGAARQAHAPHAEDR